MRSLLQSLNPEQRLAVLHESGPLLILAGAGSGKTRVITTRVAHLVAARGVAPRRILAVTFTNKAAREMRERTRELIGDAARGVTISTFHAFGAALLRENAAAVGLNAHFTIYDRDDQLTVLRAVLATEEFAGTGGGSGGGGRARPDEAYRLGVLYRISALKSRGLDPAAARAAAAGDGGGEWGAGGGAEAEQVALAYTRYQNLLRSRNAVDLDDLLLLPLRLLEREDALGESLRARYSHILVDEYQDTNHVQYLLVRALARASRNLCVVGDDDQAIYGWRGADVSNILSFQADWPDARVVKLERNYRSTALILSAANQVIAHNAERSPKRLRAEMVGGERLEFLLAPAPVDEAERVVRRLERRRREQGARWREMAILYRANHLSRAFEEVLRGRAIPYHLVGGHSFYDRREVRDILAYLRFLHNPEDRTSFERIANVPRRGIGPAVIAVLDRWIREEGASLSFALEHSQLIGGLRPAGKRALAGFHTFISHHRDALGRGSGLAATVRRLLGQMNYWESLRAAAKNQEEGAGRVENAEELLRALAEYEAAQPQPTLAGFLDRLALLTDADRDSADRDGITLMTLHAAKGLEFRHVALVGFEEGILPSARALAADANAESEERRLVYVGITRARESLLLSASCTRTQAGRRFSTELSRYLDEIPPELFDLPPRVIENRFRRKRPAPATRGGPRDGRRRGDQTVRGTAPAAARERPRKRPERTRSVERNRPERQRQPRTPRGGPRS